MTFQQFATSTFGTRLWMWLGRWLPPNLGQFVGRTLANALGRHVGSAVYRTVYANQAIVHGPQASPADIHAAARAVFLHAARASYDLMHILGSGEDAIRAGIEFGPSVWADIEAARASGRGVMVCGAHLSNFNLALVAFSVHGLPMQILSPPGPHGGFEIINQLRSRGLLEDTPIDGTALKKAIRRLRSGGMTLTGADWPQVPWEREPIMFFRRPARLPTGHIRLAISSNAVVLPVACQWEAKRGYSVRTAAPLVMECVGDRAADVRHNARRLLAIFEQWISERPDQWLMYYPVWNGNNV